MNQSAERVLREQVTEFVGWIADLVQARTLVNFNYFLFRTSIAYRYNLLANLEMVLDEFDFKMLVINADSFCECQNKYVCSYCLVDQLTYPLVIAAIQNLPPVGLELLEQLR